MDGEPVRAPLRVYEKGAERYKHAGTMEVPEIVFIDGVPKYALGKCPKGIPNETKTQLLNEAVPAANGNGEQSYPKRLHVVHEGAIYRAETSTAGKSYHAFPYSGKLGKALIAELGEMADRKNCRRAFDKWVIKYITPHGK